MAGSLRGVTIVEMETGLAAYRSTSELRRVTEGGGEDVSLPPPTDFILQFGASDSAASLMAFGHHASSFADDELAYPSVGFALDLEGAPTWLATRIWMTLPASRGNATSALSLDRPVVSPMSSTCSQDATTGKRHYRPCAVTTSREATGAWTLTSQPHPRRGEHDAGGILMMMRPAGSWPWSGLSVHLRSQPAGGRAGIDLRAHLDLVSFQADPST